MAELTITTFLSLDGVMQAPGGPEEDTSGGFKLGGWVFPFFDDDMGKIIDGNFSRADAFLLGRHTYDIFAAYWPKITNPNDIVASKLNSLPKFIPSKTQTKFTWNNSHHVKDVVKEIGEIKSRFPREVQVHGSSQLAQTLIRHDLIDEYRLFIFPVVLGSGKRLFGEGAMPGSFELKNTSITSKGTVYSVYRRSGSLKAGSFALES